MRSFTIGSGADRKLVVVEVKGTLLRLTQKKPDGTTKRSVKELDSEAEAHSESERAARQLIARGYVEKAESRSSSKSKVEKLGLGEVNASHLFDDDDVDRPAEAVEPVLSRLASAAATRGTDAPKKKKKAGGKNKKKPGAASGDGLDKRVLAGVGAVVAAVIAFGGYVAYDAFLKPSSIVGTWAGSMIDFEIGKPIIHTQYQLVLDEKQNASMTLQEKFTSVGTYAVKGNRLKLNLKEQKSAEEKAEEKTEEKAEEKAGDGAKSDETETDVREYKVKLGRSTLDLFDPNSGKQLVQLIRQSHEASPSKSAAPAAAPKGLAIGAVAPADKAEDERLASVEFAAKDGAFKVRHPTGWKAETGSRPDNTYSWASFAEGSANIKVYADIAGSLMSGSDRAGEYEEGSELAPVHNAHVLYKKTAAEEFSDYKESEPTLFKGAGLGEGRIAAFTASSGGLFGSRLRGYRVTLLTNDRRVSIFCSCPDGEFAKRKPTFLAVCRSLSR